MTIDEARAQLADIDQTCRIAHLADLRDGETIDFRFSFGQCVEVTVSRHRSYRKIEYLQKSHMLADMGRHPLLQLIGPVGFVAAIAAELLSGWRAGERRRDLLAAADFVRGRS
jgi:hypothetical protein